MFRDLKALNEQECGNFCKLLSVLYVSLG